MSSRVDLPTYPRLPRHANQRMLDRALAGDRHAREEFVKANTRLAASLIGKYHSLDPEDAFQIALEAMVKAMDTFDPSLGNTFSTWAVTVIRNALGREVTRSLTKGRGEGELSLSLDGPGHADDEGSKVTLGELVAVEDPAIDAVATNEAAQNALKMVDGIHLDIVERVYGLNGRDAERVADIAQDMGLSKARIYQQLDAALARMRATHPTPPPKTGGEGGRARALTEAQVEAICEEYARGGISQAQLAKRFGVSKRVIGRAIRGETARASG